MTPCSLIKHISEEPAATIFNLELHFVGGDSRFLRNVGNNLQAYTVT
jgi:hypothetical protein